MNNYIIKLDNKIIRKRKADRTYNYVWVRVIQKEEQVYFYKNTGETIVVKNCLNKHYPKRVTLNGQKVNVDTGNNGHEKDALCNGEFIDHIDKSKTFTRSLEGTHVTNECSKNPIDIKKLEPVRLEFASFGSTNILFSKQLKFSDEINGVRTAEFFTEERA